MAMFYLLTALFDRIGLHKYQHFKDTKMDPDAREAAKTQKVRCELCQVELTADSLASNLQPQHDVSYCYLSESMDTPSGAIGFRGSGGAPFSTAHKGRKGRGTAPTTICGPTLSSALT